MPHMHCRVSHEWCETSFGSTSKASWYMESVGYIKLNPKKFRKYWYALCTYSRMGITLFPSWNITLRCSIKATELSILLRSALNHILLAYTLKQKRMMDLPPARGDSAISSDRCGNSQCGENLLDRNILEWNTVHSSRGISCSCKVT